MKRIKLTQGKEALVSDEDYNAVMAKGPWFAQLNRINWYAMRNILLPNGKRTTLTMHRFLTGELKGIEIDHIDGDGLNNQRENLRTSTHSQNLRNRGKPINNTSGYKGVTWNKRDKRYVVMITISGKRTYIGGYHTAIEAARAYNEVAAKHYGDFAKLNEL